MNSNVTLHCNGPIQFKAVSRRLSHSTVYLEVTVTHGEQEFELTIFNPNHVGLGLIAQAINQINHSHFGGKPEEDEAA